jgi:hypothetical protein
MKLWCLDSNNKQIEIGSIVKRPVTVNQEFHGEFSYSEVVNRGGFPVLSYLMSDKGYKLPPDYLACHLSDLYDPKSLIWISPNSMPSPMNDEIFIIDKANLPFPLITGEEWVKIKERERKEKS